MKILSLLTLTAMLSVTACAHKHGCCGGKEKSSCSKEESKKSCCKDSAKKCKDGSCKKSDKPQS